MTPLSKQTSPPVHILMIQDFYRARNHRNHRYSMRAFASSMDVHPSALCRILSGKQKLSIKASISVLHRLQLSPNEQKQFIASVVEEIAEAAESLLKAAASNFSDKP